jgi:hypothetical protein
MRSASLSAHSDGLWGQVPADKQLAAECGAPRIHAFVLRVALPNTGRNGPHGCRRCAIRCCARW